MRSLVAAAVMMTAGIGAAHGTTLTTLLSFNRTNGNNPQAGLIIDSSGDLFGTSLSGGANSRGVVFEVVKGTTGYSVKDLVSFNGSNGQAAFGGLYADASGNLYGTTAYGGGVSDGNIYKLKKGATSYTISNLAIFSGANGSSPCRH